MKRRSMEACTSMRDVNESPCRRESPQCCDQGLESVRDVDQLRAENNVVTGGDSGRRGR
jgi:hypothetical protein